MEFDRLPMQSWYPGHMRKAERQIQERLQIVDVILELRDARAPMSSQNPVLAEVVKSRERLILLAKKDLAEPEQTKGWVEQLSAEHVSLAVSMKDRDLVPRIRKAIRASGAHQRLKVRRRLRAMVVGLPNVGKSTLINRMVGRKAAATGPRPGVTRSQQWVALDDELEVLDTPGIMMPRIADAVTGLRLGLVAAWREEHIGEILLAHYLIHALSQQNRLAALREMGVAVCDEEAATLEAFAERRGFVQGGGELDLDRAAKQLLLEFRNGALGRMTLDRLSAEPA